MIYLAWFLLSFVVAGLGESRKITGIGAFFLSLILSPLIGFIIVMLSDKKNKNCKHCGSGMKPDDIFCPACDRDKKGISKYQYKAS